MRKGLMMFVVLAGFGLAGCSDSSKQNDTDMMLGERSEITHGPISGENGSMPVEGVHGQRLGGATPGTMEDLTVNVGDRVYFGYDRYDLTPEALTQLQMQARWLQQYPNLSVVIEGHADERGTREYNLALGDRRATSVKNYLASIGVSSSRVRTISYGKEMAEVLGSSPQSWAQNRRSITRVE